MRSKYYNEDLITNLIVNAETEQKDPNVIISPSMEVKAKDVVSAGPTSPTTRGRRSQSSKTDQRADIEDRLRKFVSTRYSSPSKHQTGSKKLIQQRQSKSPKSPGKIR
jgi:hypothetical protein